MAWLSRVNFISSDTLSFTDINNLGNDIRAWGDNVNGGGYMLSNVAISASSGTMGLVIGGTGTTSTLRLRSTSGVGTTGADIIFQAGNNGATEVMRLQNGGNVGIGLAFPATILDVGYTTATDGFISFTSGSLSRIRLGYQSSATPTSNVIQAQIFADSVGNLNISSRTNSASGIIFYTNSATTASERMRIDSSGNVLVGATSSSLGKFVTSGSEGFAYQGANIAVCARFQTGANNAILFDTIGVTNASGYRRGIWWGYGSDDFNISRFTNDGTTNFITDLHVSSAGNVGIGTPSPATSARLEIAGTTGALLVPRLTTTERNALSAVNGMIIYNTTDNQMQGRINGVWVAM